ncbi:MAG: class I SAM-dependent methyltransferase [Dehalococcoidales bacterium]|jgi:SAM-dependent methyltransferase
MNEYWDKRYSAEGKIWGDAPSGTAVTALELFRQNKVNKVLVPGSGYGRNTRLFAASGFKVTGVEISFEACRLATTFDPRTRIFNLSALDMTAIKDKFDGLYGFNVLHLFRAGDRQSFVRQCAARMKKNGIMFFTVFSEREPSYGKGAEVEPGTFESKPGRPVHYFTENDLKEHFKGMEITATGLAADPEDHGEGPHTHILRYICLKAG